MTARRRSRSLRPGVIALLLLPALAGCGSGYYQVQKIDTIEAWESWLADHPGNAHELEARLRLEELYLDRARQEHTIEAYDRYLAKYPPGSGAKLTDTVLAEREGFLFDWADRQDSAEAWRRFLDEYPHGRKAHKQEARRRIEVAAYRDRLRIGPPRVRPVNLAEDPDGPMNGFAVEAPVTNDGDRTITELDLRVDLLSPAGRRIDSATWPLVAPSLPGNVPVEDEFKIPVAPGETRTFSYTTEPPEGDWQEGVRLVPVRIRFADGPAAR